MAHTEPLLVFDWDDVIADRAPVRRAVSELLTLAGVSPEFEHISYERTRQAGGYNFRRQLREVLRQYPHLVNVAPALHRAFEETMLRLSHIVYPDAQRFVVRVHGRLPMAFVTTGDPEFAQQKVHRSGLDQFVAHMIFLPHDDEAAAVEKSRALGRLLEMYPHIFFFEDQPSVIGQVHTEHQRHGRITPIRVDRKLESTLKYPNIIRHFDEFDLDRWVGNGS